MSYEKPSPDSWDQPPDRGYGRAFSARWWRARWRRLTGFVRRRRRQTDMPEVATLKMPELLDVHQPSDTFTFETPAQGDGFSFRVKVRCSWCVQATATEEAKERRIEEVRTFIEENRAVTRERIEETVRPIARSFPPYRAAEAERQLNKEIVDCLNDGDVRVTIKAWVDVCDPVREELKKVWLQRLVADADGDMREAYVDLLRVLQVAWKDLLVEGLEEIRTAPEDRKTWLAPYALALAENPKNAAPYLKAALEDRVDETQKLLRDLGAMLVDDRLEAIDFAFQSNSALRRLLTHLGVPVHVENGAFDGAVGHD